MAWKAELTEAGTEDLRRIYRHLLNAQHEDFGHDLAAADRLARSRIEQIVDNIDRITFAPFRGTQIGPADFTFRYLTIDRAIYWFRLDEVTETVLIEAIFLAGQDHLKRMFARLTGKAR